MADASTTPTLSRRFPNHAVIALLVAVLAAGCAGNRDHGADTPARGAADDEVETSAGNPDSGVAATQDDRNDDWNDDWDDDDWEDWDDYEEVWDPFERVNRWTFVFNQTFDAFILRPTAEFYDDYTPEPVKEGVGNFMSNLGYPVTIVNGFLQGEIRQGAGDTLRFIVNSTVGLLGIFDVAQHMDLPEHRADFGQTLGVWGVGDGPYLVLPFLGPSNVRDGTGLGVQYLTRRETGPLHWAGASHEVRYAAIAVDAVDTRARLLPATRLMEEIAFDPYVFLRDAYSQRRRALIEGDEPPEEHREPYLYE